MNEPHSKGYLDVKVLEYLQLLQELGTLEQKVAVAAVLKHRNWKDAADELGVTRNSLQNRVGRLRRAAARRGFSPDHDMTEAAPEGFLVKGVSTYYQVDPETGEKTPKGQWVKTKQIEQDKYDALCDAIQGLAENVKDKSEYIPPPETNNEDLLCIYPMGDPHIGMHAWAEETRDRNFNLKLAERNLLATVDHLVDLAPPAKTGIVLNLGDFFHADSGKNTTTYGTAVDVDGRMAKVLRTGVDIMIAVVLAALRKHEKVIGYCLIGNHDDLMSVVLAICLDKYFDNNPRVEIVTRPSLHHYYEFGDCLFGMHHGHATKPSDLSPFMASDMREAWGRTRFRHYYCGHIHHDTVKEYPGCTVETFRTMAPSDAWHAGRFRSGNDMKLDVWHKKRGHINRHIVGIETILDLVGTEDD